MSFDYERLKLLKQIPVLKAQGHAFMQDNPLAYFYLGGTSKAEWPRYVREWVDKTTLSREQQQTASLIGVEIEVEKCRPQTVDQALYDEMNLYWNATNDGSLRNNGVEYVSRKGLTTVTLPPALDVLLSRYLPIATKNQAEANARTGLHIHVNVADMDIYTLCNVLFLYSVLEPVIFVASGNRCENLFCVPWYQNQVSLGSVVKDLSDYAFAGKGGSIGDLHRYVWQFRWRNYSKYCGLNISTVATYNTLEFRMHEGTLDPTRIQKWMDILERLFRVAKTTDTVDNIHKFRTNRNDAKYQILCETVFGNEIHKLLTPQVLDDCRLATNNFFKMFVNRASLPENTTVTTSTKRPGPIRERRFDEPDELPAFPELRENRVARNPQRAVEIEDVLFAQMNNFRPDLPALDRARLAAEMRRQARGRVAEQDIRALNNNVPIDNLDPERD